MKRILAFSLVAAVMGAIGCTTVKPENNYQADAPPPLARDEAKPKQRSRRFQRKRPT